LNGGAGRAPTPEGVIEGVSSLGNDLATLATLQARLAALDLRDSLLEARVALIVLATGLLLIPCCLVVGLFGLAGWLAERLHASANVVMMLLAVGILILSAVGAVFAARRVGGSFTSFRRSQDELQRNLTWVRTVLAQSGR
jgi:hypothetical protein